ncbi:hypothetical protein JCM11641_002431 [Rhodosporidiobolus odoratus]
MDDTSPPGYSAAPSTSTVLLNLAPPAQQTTFQLGHLGYGPAFVAGDVQVKYAGSQTDPRPAFSRLDLIFRGVEKSGGQGGEEIELCEQSKVIWGVGAAGSSSSAATAEDGGAFPPSSTPFKLELTPDLPACLHLPDSSLEYTLVAMLHYADSALAPLVRCSPVHLARTSPPGSLLAGISLAALSDPPPSTAPRTFSASSPLPFSVRFPRTVFRRSEPIELVTRIEVPDAKAVGSGMRLRTVSAELVRTIRVSEGPQDSSEPSRSGAGIDETRRDELLPSSPTEPSVRRTVLAHSGKSARFSPSRPIVIKLVLHPPAELSCESITQSTILHNISFSIIVTIGLVNTSSSASSSTSIIAPSTVDATLSQTVFIVPDLASSRSDKQKEVDRAAAEAFASSSSSAVEPWMLLDRPVPTYVEDSQEDPGETAPAASGSGSNVLDAAEQEQLRRSYTAAPAFGDEEEEFDGYLREDLALPATISGRPPPPAIDDDVSPPSASDAAGSLSFEVATAQGLAALEEDDERDEPLEPYTPPPNDFSPESDSLSPPPPLFEAHDQQPGDVDHEPTTPPPLVDFPPLPALDTYLSSTPPINVPHGSPSPPRSPPPPASPLDSDPVYLHLHHPQPSSALGPSYSSQPPPSLCQPHAAGPRGAGGEGAGGGEEGLPPPYFGAPAYSAAASSSSPPAAAPLRSLGSRSPSLDLDLGPERERGYHSRRYDPSFDLVPLPPPPLLPPVPFSATQGESAPSSEDGTASGEDPASVVSSGSRAGSEHGGSELTTQAVPVGGQEEVVEEEEDEEEARPPPYEDRDRVVELGPDGSGGVRFDEGRQRQRELVL